MRASQEIKRLAPVVPGRMMGFWLLFALVILAGVGTFLVLKMQLLSGTSGPSGLGLRPVISVMRTNHPAPSPVENSGNDHSAAGADLHGGTQE